MELTLQIFQFILSISILVILHELGHFLPAKWFKTKVEKFYLFFDPWFSVAKKKIGETEYGIGWLPLGGYVKIAGMVDESMDTEQLKKPAEPWEFRSKPAWQRLIIMLGGVTVNFFLAWLIFAMLTLFNGENIFNNNSEIPLHYTDVAKKMGFQDGDKLLKVDGKLQTDMKKLAIDVLLSDEITVLRNGKEVTFATNDDGKAEAFKTNEPKAFLTPRIAPVVDTITMKSTEDGGLKIGDLITKVNGKPIQFYDEVSPIVTQNAGKKIDIEVSRANNILQPISLQVSKDGKAGFGSFKAHQKYITKKEYNLFGAISRGYTQTIESLTYQIKSFKLVFNKKVKGYKNVTGPIGIVKQMPIERDKDNNISIDWSSFWAFTAMFSVWLAFVNLIPIPGLDGGHVVFTLWEMITGKPVPQKVLENAQMIGVVFLLGLMILIFGNDIFKIFTGKL